MTREFVTFYDCPHCGQGWQIPADDAILTDDVGDGESTKCGECGGEFQLRCKSVDIEIEVLIDGKVVE